MAMAEDEGLAEFGSGSPPAGGMSTITFILVLVGLTVAAGGLGFVGGLQILASAEQSLLSKAKDGQGAAEVADTKAANLKVLAPIVTNLSDGRDAWIRLESSLLFRDEIPPDADALATKIGEDIVAFLRTVSLKQIEGASGFQHLSEDLNDRVRVRSKGRVQELIIQGLIVE
jgi:flagellar FliL protein